MHNLGTAWALLRFYFRVVPTSWYRKYPFLPAPPPDYIAWRLRTAYGKRPPGWGVLLHDLWQFGRWLRDFGP